MYDTIEEEVLVCIIMRVGTFTPIRGTMRRVWRRNRWHIILYTSIYIYIYIYPRVQFWDAFLSHIVVDLYYRGGVCDLSPHRRPEICKSASAATCARTFFIKKKLHRKKRLRHSGVGTAAIAEEHMQIRTPRLKGLKIPNAVAPGRLLCYVYIITFVNKTAPMVARTYTAIHYCYMYIYIGWIFTIIVIYYR